jgi:hypothetical protein
MLSHQEATDVHSMHACSTVQCWHLCEVCTVLLLILADKFNLDTSADALHALLVALLINTSCTGARTVCRLYSPTKLEL